VASEGGRGGLEQTAWPAVCHLTHAFMPRSAWDPQAWHEQGMRLPRASSLTLSCLLSVPHWDWNCDLYRAGMPLY